MRAIPPGLRMQRMHRLVSSGGIGMYVIFDEVQRLHSPQARLFAGKIGAYPDKPERAEKLLAGARAFGCVLRAPRDFGVAPLLAAHDPAYLEFLRTAHRRWLEIPDASPEVFPHVY